MRTQSAALLAMILSAGHCAAAGPKIPLPRERPLFDDAAVLPSTLPPPGWRATPILPSTIAPGQGESDSVKPSAVPSGQPSEVSACQLRLGAELATIRALPPITGPGACGGTDLVALQEVVLADRTRVAVMPPATLRCPMAEAVVHWVRDEVAKTAAGLGAALRQIENFDSFDCRGRNRVVGAKLSEHGRANALDIRSIRLADGRALPLAEPVAPLAFRAALRTSACARFTTVLGPGSDGYHENHVHVDLAERRGGYRLCQWNLQEPAPPSTIAAGDSEEPSAESAVPVPRPRPRLQADRRGTRRERL